MSPPSPALAAIGPEIASARPAPLPGDLIAAADALGALDARLVEAQARDGLTRVKRSLLTRQRERLSLLAAAARAVRAARPQRPRRHRRLRHAARAARVELAVAPRAYGPGRHGGPADPALGAMAHPRRSRKERLRACARPARAREPLRALRLGAHQRRRLRPRRRAARLPQARALLGLVSAEVRDSERLGDHAAFWTLLEHGHAAAVAALVYIYGEEHVAVPPL